MLFIGKYNYLTIERVTSVGMFLSDVEGEEVLLPNQYITDDMQVGDQIKVFVYLDSEDRPVATTQTPKIIRNEFAFLEVKDVSEYGAFLDWGLIKDLFVPFREQPKPMEIGEWHVVFLYLDQKSQRLLASAKIDKFLESERLTVAEGDEVDLLVWQKTDLGYNVVVNQYHKGLIYANEVFQPLQIGDSLKGYVKKIREENKLDISLQKTGYEVVEPVAKQILEEVKKGKGFLNLSDSSSPEDIYNRLKISKKVFKKAIGGLYKQGIIRITDDGIYLVGES
ncbi:putative RNA-binding protein (virulence factor B family) [Dyadobacter sp. BE34]|uniref:RNA-binding protein (Virulence factor B family) n=1 Tax=Dyadobacter fermentans TaxID=94254 RepID=A0ABU1QT10_9BACT|nr:MULTISPECIES: S1-like domain-containing RNA-binding protein [Dyadobacter]MDR6804137.1 putative RNA-binding protein (virulence factor B family) [Dyadobacter fermentans]MDR7041877.1 putative RNA-binding protein (virulence factor B family) [Dyadobacter sp. BE242]MDR7196280.1 putative RNA-binding protein (virulence factor B family) [Dyadobacter sp. BE34]MDR7213175.1 putative RNA-binding protein (virulence factor B family) [Dyadobacter sp. BE31]MDR7261686.1 putative RNA-binding protein (virulenc